MSDNIVRQAIPVKGWRAACQTPSDLPSPSWVEEVDAPVRDNENTNYNQKT
jgi:hypothetical protein